MKKRIVAGFLSVVLSLSLTMTTFAADLPQAPSVDETVVEEIVGGGQNDDQESVEDADMSNPDEKKSDEKVSDEKSSDKQDADVAQADEEKKGAEPVAASLDAEAKAEVKEADAWTSADFIYTQMEQTLNGCEYTREFTIKGLAVAGFSEAGAEKIKTNKNLVIPSKDPNGTTIVGVADAAFKSQGIQTLKLPEGMMVDYDDPVVSRRGNFLIGASAFYGNELTSLTLPEGVIYIGSMSFAKNQLSYLKIPHTFWWLENQAFANNKLTTVGFPQTCDFQAQIHAMAFAGNQIKSVRLPDYIEVVYKTAFNLNPGMEPCPSEAPEKEQGLGGVVYMYTDNPELLNKERIHHIDRTAGSQHSWHQKLIVGENPNVEQSWTIDDFTYDGTVVTGLSESGIEKRKDHRELVIPDKNGNGEWITEIAASTASYGTFAAEGEGFDTVVLPSKVEKIGNRAFCNIGLRSVEFPGTLKEIGIAAFQMNQLVTVVLPDSVTALGGGAFGTNPTIEKVILSKGLTEIASGAFGCSDAKNYMTNFKEIVIPEGITAIGANAFAGNNFTVIKIPSTVKTIGKFAFSTKNYLSEETTLELPEGLETIGDYAFRNQVIKKVTLPTTVTALPKNVFLKDYSDGTETVITKVYVSNEAQYNEYITGTSENFPKSETHRLVLKTPETETIWNAEDFTYGLIKQDMASVDEKIKVTVEGTGITGLSEDGQAKLDVNPNMVIPAEDYNGNKIIGVGAKAFYKEARIESVSFPEGVMADYEGDGIAKGVTQRGNFVILSNAFYGTAIKALDLPEGIIYIGNNAFNSNTKLTSIKIPHTIWQIASAAFAKCALTSVEFPETCDFKLNLDAMAFGMNQIKAVRLPDRTEKVMNNVFLQNTGMEPVSEECPNATMKKGGVVYMYNENVDLTTEPYIAHLDGTIGNGYSGSGDKSWAQKFLNEEMPANLQPWNALHFTFDGTTITGFTEAGKAKLADGATEVTLPKQNPNGEAVTAIGVSAFATAEMTKVTIPETVTSIGQTAFRATKLTEVVLPDSIEILGLGAFTACAELSFVTLSKNLKDIPQGAFQAAKLTEVVIPEGVATIGRTAFADSPITKLVLPSTLTEVGRDAFKGHQLEELTIPENVKKIDQGAFSQELDGRRNVLKKVTLNDGLKIIGEYAFRSSALQSVNIPDSLTTLHKNAFSGSKNEQVKLFTSNKAHLEETTTFIPESAGHKVIYDEIVGSGWTHDDFTYDGNIITGWSEQGNKTRLENHNLVLPSLNPDTLEPITAIADKAFQIPDGEWEQGKDGVTSPNGMESVAIPGTVVTIGANAFQYNSLKTVEFPASVTTVGTSAFNSNKLEALVLPDTITEVQAGAFSANNITELTISKGLTKLEQGVFSMNIRLDHIDIPDTITEIGDMAFAGARLTALEIPASVTKIGRKAFHLHHLEKLTIPGTVKEIGDSAFEGTPKAITLKELVIEEGVETIGEYAFREGYLESVKLPDSLKSLGKNAFYANAGTNNDHVVVLYTKNQAHLEMKMDETCQKIVYMEEDKSALKAAIEKAEGLKEADYTAESWKVVQKELPTVLETAKEVVGNLDATKEEIKAATDALNEVLAKLKAVEKPNPNPNPDPDPDNPGGTDIPGTSDKPGQTSPDGKPGSQNASGNKDAAGNTSAKTGDTSNALPLAGGMAVAGVVILALLKKRRTMK